MGKLVGDKDPKVFFIEGEELIISVYHFQDATNGIVSSLAVYWDEESISCIICSFVFSDSVEQRL